MTTAIVNIYRCASITQAAATLVFRDSESSDPSQSFERNRIILLALGRSGYFLRCVAFGGFLAAVYCNFDEPVALEQKLRETLTDVEISLDVSHKSVTDAEYREALLPRRQ